MNRYPLWKNLLILVVLAIGTIYALPNMFRPDPAIQISTQNSGHDMDEAALARATQALQQAGIPYFGESLQKRSALVRLKAQADQLKGQEAVKRAMGDEFVVALNMAATTPGWLKALGAGPMKLGLDLSGGVHFLMEVDTQAAVSKRLDAYLTELKTRLREKKVRGLLAVEGGRIVGQFQDAETRGLADGIVAEAFPVLVRSMEEAGGSYRLIAELPPKEINTIATDAVSQNLTTLRNRVNELGVAEPLVQQQGRNRIVVELPGVQDTAEAKRVLGKTANLEFRLEAKADAASWERETFSFHDDMQKGRTADLERKLVITGEQVAGAQSGYDENGRPQVSINLDSAGGQQMNRATRHSVGRNLGVLFIERKTRTRYVTNAEGQEEAVYEKYDEKKIISLATIRDALGSSFRVTGLDSPAEASELALLLRAGALAAPMDFVEERTVGPSLGAANIQQGVTAVWVGFILVTLFMLYYYRVFGLAAIIALAINLVLLIACMSVLSATLTMPGIAGIALTVGMSVDANVLVFARIREELKNGMSPQSAIQAGFDRAFITIVDSNLTALLVAVILYAVGTGPVRGFAVTLALGIITSMFTAVTVTRAIINLSVGGRRLTKLWI